MNPERPGPDVPIEENPKRLTHRMEWEIRRARKMSGGSLEMADWTAITLPDLEGLRHAALVVAGRLADLPDAVDATREVLEALDIPRSAWGRPDG